MTLSRRDLLALGAGAAFLPALSSGASAQAYPIRAVRWVVPFPPGGVTDIVARVMGQWLTERLGQPFVVDNRPGASGNIGTESVVRAPADGHTLLLAGAFNVINAAVLGSAGFDFVRDVAPVAGLIRTYYVVVVHPSVPVATLPELIAFAKADPGRLNMASAGNGSPHQAAGELFRMMTGVGMSHVPYRGAAPALNDLVAGHVQIMFDNLTSSLQHIRDGKLRALAVTSATRSPLLPDLPTVGEFVPGYEASGWLGVGAPRDTPKGVVEMLNAAINRGLGDARIAARLGDLGGTPLVLSPADLGSLVTAEVGKWARVVAFAGIKPD